MKHILAGVLICLSTLGANAFTLTYNHLDTINLRDQGFAADERETNALIAKENLVYGVTSGDRCLVFCLKPSTKKVRILAALPGPNTVMKGFTIADDALYVGTMLTKKQLALRARLRDRSFDPEDANLIPIDDSWNTGHLYRITSFEGENPQVEDLGMPVEGQGIHTLAWNPKRRELYGVTYPSGRLFVYDPANSQVRSVTFGHTYTTVSNHQVGIVEVVKELADLVPGEGEWNNRLAPNALWVRSDGNLFTSGWQGQILWCDTETSPLAEGFKPLGYLPSVPGRQYWNRIDAITEHQGKLYLGTSDGYIVRLDPDSGEMENLGKPIRSVEVMGFAFSPLDGRLYGVSGGGLEGISRFWCCDVEKGTFLVDYPALPVIPNCHRIGDVVCTADGTLVLSEAFRIGNLYMLTSGQPKEWEKSGILPEANPQEGRPPKQPDSSFEGRKKLEVEVFPIPSKLHGGSGYTAIQADRDGKIYVGTAYYGKQAQLVQLDPDTAEWRCLFRSDDLTHQYGRGQGIPGKIHTKLRLGDDGKIYGAMKQGYELHYRLRSDIGEAPEGKRGSQFTCHFFCYDPVSDQTTDLGPGKLQEGITSFAVDTKRGYLYGATVPGVSFLVLDLETGRVWDMGQIGYDHPTRYMPRDPETGRVYHPGETTPEGRAFMTVWDPEEFRLKDVEIVPEKGFKYQHSYATCCGPAGTKTLYGRSGDFLFEMELDDSKDGRFHVRPVCSVGVDGSDKNSGLYAIERGPDGRIYWASTGGHNVPIDLFAYDPQTKKKTYLGSCALGGEWIRWNSCQGICLDSKGNLSLHVLYAEISKEQQRYWKVPGDFFYEDIEKRPYYLNYPIHAEGTFYAVYYLRNATSIR